MLHQPFAPEPGLHGPLASAYVLLQQLEAFSCVCTMIIAVSLWGCAATWSPSGPRASPRQPWTAPSGRRTTTGSGAGSASWLSRARWVGLRIFISCEIGLHTCSAHFLYLQQCHVLFWVLWALHSKLKCVITSTCCMGLPCMLSGVYHFQLHFAQGGPTPQGPHHSARHGHGATRQAAHIGDACMRALAAHLHEQHTAT